MLPSTEKLCRFLMESFLREALFFFPHDNSYFSGSCQQTVLNSERLWQSVSWRDVRDYGCLHRTLSVMQRSVSDTSAQRFSFVTKCHRISYKNRTAFTHYVQYRVNRKICLNLHGQKQHILGTCLGPQNIFLFRLNNWWNVTDF